MFEINELLYSKKKQDKNVPIWAITAMDVFVV